MPIYSKINKTEIKQTLIHLAFSLEFYALFLAILLLEKPLFLATHASAHPEVTAFNWLEVLWHGLAMDLSAAGFLTILPVALLALSRVKHLSLRAFDIYTGLALLLAWAIAVPDVAIYGFWGTHMDAPTILFYLRQPGDVAASFTLGLVAKNLGLMALFGGVSWILYARTVRRQLQSIGSPPHLGGQLTHPKLFHAFVILAVGGLLFIPIRGGLSTATMNVGRVYFSQTPFLNHAAISPFWNFMDSFNWRRNYRDEYRFMDEARAHQLFQAQTFTAPRPIAPTSYPNGRLDAQNSDQGTKNLNIKHPNILLIILESFSGRYIAPLGGEEGVTPRLNALFQESIAFTNVLASGTRTDSGIVAILGGFPAQPKGRIMARPDKSLALPSLGKVLQAQGYDLGFYYGGDENFANMRSYLVGNGFEKIVGESDFSKSERRTKWGVYDHVLFQRLMADLKDWNAATTQSGDSTQKGDQTRPFFKVALTLTSHEPFEIPTEPKFPQNSLVNRYKSSLFYADSALGDFMDAAKTQPWWENTLVILVADHATPYPDMQIHERRRYVIPLLWTGGAIRQPKSLATLGSQTDLAATLLGELGLDHGDFTFSIDLFDPKAPKRGFFTFNEGFGFEDATGGVSFDCASEKVVEQTCPSSAETSCLDRGKAYLQVLFDTMEELRVAPTKNNGQMSP